MKSLLLKITIVMALVLTSMGICFSSDTNCDDSLRAKSSVSKDFHSKNQSEKSEEKNPEHHCICSLTCHNLYIEFSIVSTKPEALVITQSVFTFKNTIYPQVHLSLDKPPIV